MMVNEIERLLEEMDKFKAGDKTAFEGMTVHLDSEDRILEKEEEKQEDQ